jgi:hypothetical protein
MGTFRPDAAHLGGRAFPVVVLGPVLDFASARFARCWRVVLKAAALRSPCRFDVSKLCILDFTSSTTCRTAAPSADCRRLTPDTVYAVGQCYRGAASTAILILPCAADNLFRNDISVGQGFEGASGKAWTLLQRPGLDPR